MRFVVTAGPTREFIDPVRFLSNPSTGRMGFAVARAARAAGHEVTLIAGPVALKTPRGVRRIDVISARDMLAAVQAELNDTDALVMTAAVADWRPARRAVRKLKKSEMSDTLKLVRNPDILRTINRQLHTGTTGVSPVDGGASRTPRPTTGTTGVSPVALIRIGFAAETGAPTAEAVRKCREKGLDLVVGNDVTARGSGFGTTTNRVTFVTPDGRVQRLPLMSKLAVARRIVRFAESAVTGRPPYQPAATKRKGANA